MCVGPYAFESCHHGGYSVQNRQCPTPTRNGQPCTNRVMGTVYLNGACGRCQRTAENPRAQRSRYQTLVPRGVRRGPGGGGGSVRGWGYPRPVDRTPGSVPGRPGNPAAIAATTATAASEQAERARIARAERDGLQLGRESAGVPRSQEMAADSNPARAGYSGWGAVPGEQMRAREVQRIPPGRQRDRRRQSIEWHATRCNVS